MRGPRVREWEREARSHPAPKQLGNSCCFKVTPELETASRRLGQSLESGSPLGGPKSPRRWGNPRLGAARRDFLASHPSRPTTPRMKTCPWGPRYVARMGHRCEMY